jgi:ribonuclease HI
MKPEIVIYTDGASKGNPGPGGWGVYAMIPGGYYEQYGGKLHATNNEMELTAAIKALKFALDNYQDHKVIIYTDSTYVKNGITKWMANWIRNGWKTAAKKPVKNKNLWVPLSKLNSLLSVEWRWVKGHSDNEGNNRADELANKGVPNA